MQHGKGGRQPPPFLPCPPALPSREGERGAKARANGNDVGDAHGYWTAHAAAGANGSERGRTQC
eukprot:2012935-Pyramimonas_sp.AAC.1